MAGRNHVPTKKGTSHRKRRITLDHRDMQCRRHKSNLKQGEANVSALSSLLPQKVVFSTFKHSDVSHTPACQTGISCNFRFSEL